MQRAVSAKMAAWIADPVTPGGRIEVIHYVYRHRKKLSAGAVSATLKYFNVVPGDTEAGATLNEDSVNLKKKNAITSPYKFLVTGINVDCQPHPTLATRVLQNASTLKSIADDIAEVLAKGMLKFTVLQKEYVNEAPLSRLPSGAGLTGQLAASQAGEVAASHDVVALLNNGHPHVSNQWWCEIPLEPEANFEVEILFPSVVPTVDTGNELELSVFLDGLLQRPEV